MKSTLCIEKQIFLDNPGMYLEIAAERPISIVEGARLLRLEEVVPATTEVSEHDKTICAALVMDSSTLKQACGVRAQHTWRTCFVRRSIGEKHKTYPETHYRPKSGKEAGDSGNKYICEKDCHQQSRGFAALGKGDGRSNAQSTYFGAPLFHRGQKTWYCTVKAVSIAHSSLLENATIR